MDKIFISLIVAMFPLLSLFASAQTKNVGIGTNLPDQSAILDLNVSDNTEFPTKMGMLMPRVALTAINVASPITNPATSLIVYNTSTGEGLTPGFYFWNGTEWKRMLSGTAGEAISFTGGSDRLAITSGTGNLTTMDHSKISGNYVMIGANEVGSVAPNAVLHINGGNILISPTIGSPNIPGQLRFGTNATNVALKANEVTQSSIYTLPDAVGTANQVLGISSVSGNECQLAWTDNNALPTGTANKTIYWNGTQWTVYDNVSLLTPSGTGADTISVQVSGDLKVTGDLLVIGNIDPESIIFTPQASALSGTSQPGQVYFSSTDNTLKVNAGTTTTANWVDVVTSATNSDCPVGSIIRFAGSVAPDGWLLCDGSTVSRTTYQALFVAMGSPAASGDGSTTFALPTLNGTTENPVTPVYIVKY